VPAPAVEARSLYRFFHAGDDETLALRGVTLVVEPGEFVTVAGPSGSGKSTLLSCLAGLDNPDGGMVSIAGRVMSRKPEPERAALRRDRVGLQSQSSSLFPHLTVAQNVSLAKELKGRGSRSERRPDSTATNPLEMVELEHRRDAYPHQLSGGETARAGLAVALANGPAVLLADEPTGELDGAGEAQLLDLLRAQAGRGVAVVVASHSPAVISAADRVMWLSDGIEVPG
jgi:putative ABC transport system ATP-binding protein